MVVEKALIVDPIEGEYTGDVEFEEEIINIKRYDCTPKYVLMPGFVDTHTHGYMGIDCMNANKEDFEKWAEYVSKDGVTYLFPTTVSHNFEKLNKVTENFSSANHHSLIGLHFEGPFINPKKSGAQNIGYIKDYEGKLPSLKNVKIITFAPEINGAERLLKSLPNNIVPSIGHSDAPYELFKKFLETGVNRITHFPNALSSMHHRNIGIVGGVFLHKPYVELIVDFIHSSPEFIKLVYDIIGPPKIILITDSISATGLKDGIYELGDLLVKVKDKTAKLEDGTLAGSTLRYIEGVKNFKKITNCSLQELSLVSSFNALQNLNFNMGRIKKGYIAKFVLLNENLDILKIFQ
ncbi:N-acetylglucosamine-6-phosphate deacetylase [Thermosipho melanesiensis]|uniref:N-acetylglucosamine-6-phosphate deacetylase n=2 Tax=Thermosipho melanesiensis TaxID=46541 RepID=A6LKV7_THEM4|nr:N-acetylglucosamine-6-phosphate deacetylase [Thermosipho melanesiensis]ABR30558.1 N-acetylglucosamine-6-phosphate deacetylase [Thermosipho melanesiensis BI429]APT73706.1 N-acetylglucosamine-6-phosphate deacetylase [Thermosipho melanesiensis]OOC35645.1 N-acetylglucosamine-6-phosphate deacetylase [Thermosipho melanesiensis]OOC39320.1 N-acetylglucosamine-6-phosphate deacetylase [Thermosipho melanesiensis]OOC39406.1 N-acetylglucosamine-6-phosphate deacetylase [Thermosipho melanesiensis]